MNFDLNDVSFVALLLRLLLFWALKSNVSFFSSFILQKGDAKPASTLHCTEHHCSTLRVSSTVHSALFDDFFPVLLLSQQVHTHTNTFRLFSLSLSLSLTDAIQIGPSSTFVLPTQEVHSDHAAGTTHPLRVKVKTRTIDICKRLFFLFLSLFLLLATLTLPWLHVFPFFLLFPL